MTDIPRHDEVRPIPFVNPRLRARIVAGLALGMAFAPIVLPVASYAEGSQAEQGREVADVPDLQTVGEYDAAIRQLGSTADVADKIAGSKLNDQDKLLIMRRSFVQDAGYDSLVKWVGKSIDRAKFLEWFLNEGDVLEYYVTGGRPGGINGGGAGSHVRSISQLMDLAREYEADLRSTDSVNAPRLSQDDGLRGFGNV